MPLSQNPSFSHRIRNSQEHALPLTVDELTAGKEAAVRSLLESEQAIRAERYQSEEKERLFQNIKTITNSASALIGTAGFGYSDREITTPSSLRLRKVPERLNGQWTAEEWHDRFLEHPQVQQLTLDSTDRDNAVLRETYLVYERAAAAAVWAAQLKAVEPSQAKR